MSYKLVVGLGNPGSEYAKTRHNMGFMLVEKFLLDHRPDRWERVHSCNSFCYVGSFAGNKLILQLPQTYMNNSGEAIKEAAAFYKIPPEKCIVIFDDIDIGLGALRVKRKGSAGTHNGVKSIIQHLVSDNFPRIKIGVGSKPHPDYDLKDYVLGTFSIQEQNILKDTMEKACDAICLITDGNIDKAMMTCQLK